jgi:hypothetical protein
MFSYLDTTTNKIKTIYYNDVSISSDNTDAPSSDKEFDGLNPAANYQPKKGNFNPAAVDDYYGLNANSRLRCSSDHSVTDLDDRGPIDIRWFDIKPMYYYGTPVINSIFVNRVWTSESYHEQYIVGADVILDGVNNYYNDVIFSNVSSESGSYAYQGTHPAATFTGDVNLPLLFHDNMTLNFGDLSVSESINKNTFTVAYYNGDIHSNLKDSKGGLSSAYPVIVQNYNSQESTIVGTKDGFKSDFFVVYTGAGDGYHIINHWNNGSYAITTNGHTLKGDDYILSGTITMYANTVIGNIPIASSGQNIYLEFSSPSDSPVWYNDGTFGLSGYYSDRFARPFVYKGSSFKRFDITYRDQNGVHKSITPGAQSRIGFDNTHKNLRGKNLTINTYYDTVAGPEYLSSDPLCPTYSNYYDISDVTLTLSGVKFDKGTSTNVPYEIVYMKEEDDKVLYNKIGNKFQTIADVNVRLDFTLKANTTDLDSISRVHIPAPEEMWLIAVPKTGVNDQDLRYTFFKISEQYSLPNRDSYGKRQTFPKINTIVANSMVSKCTGSAGVPTSDGIIWQDQTLSPIYSAPSVGSFSENNYTINVNLIQGSWSFYLVVKDSTDIYTGYCISNYDKFDVPTSNSFEF